MQTVLTIGEVVKRSGVAASALRFYEERGLIQSIRSDSGHRRYRRGVLRRVAFIVFAQRIGLSLTQVAELLAELPANAAPSRKDWQRISRTWQEHLDQRLAELQRLRVGLGECIGCGCLSLDRCQLANPQDRMGKRGPGARVWLGDPRPRG
jgi:MerR family redox-sensitive transcriptional activator SoxR